MIEKQKWLITVADATATMAAVETNWKHCWISPQTGVTDLKKMWKTCDFWETTAQQMPF